MMGNKWYDASKWHLCQDTARILDALGKPAKGLRVLDVGANDEDLPNVLADAGADVTGYDLCDPKHKVLYNRIQEDFLEAKVEPGFDVVVSASALEHFGLIQYGNTTLDEDADARAVQKIHDVLKPGGEAYITVPVSQHFIVQERDWRSYSEEALIERIVGPFRDLAECKFFKSADADVPESESGWVAPHDAWAYHGSPPHVTVLLVLRKEGYRAKPGGKLMSGPAPDRKEPTPDTTPAPGPDSGSQQLKDATPAPGPDSGSQSSDEEPPKKVAKKKRARKKK